jgi:hypothetical protein
VTGGLAGLSAGLGYFVGHLAGIEGTGAAKAATLAVARAATSGTAGTAATGSAIAALGLGIGIASFALIGTAAYLYFTE